ncbi:MAG: hypothetical protein JWM76_5148 [Pseudonocardiales bacterium]|nr:hypothetical protein [Pseudonocardiales bacterium]
MRFTSIEATPEEVAADRAGDEIIKSPDAVMDRAFTLDASPEQVWPWLIQLGKQRAGWYLPRSVEQLLPRRRRALRTIDPHWQGLAVGDVIPDYGGRHETFTAAHIDPPRTLVYTSQRRQMFMSWSLTLRPITSPDTTDITRVHLRLRLGPVRRKWLVDTAGELLDALTIAGMSAGLRERLSESD